MLHLRYIEFYAGVGGWTMALQQAVAKVNTASAYGGESTPLLTTECSAAFDHSDLCVEVYQHNFASITHEVTGDCRNKSMSCTKIENLSVSDLIRYNADIWMMSPPCQPHTRQHNNQSNDINDTRSNSFLHLCRLLNDMENSEDARPPSILLLENVVGFESSNSCELWIQTLLTCHYRIAQFHLQPTQVGVPNDRPRYYCVAARDKNHTNGDVGENTNGAWISKYFSSQSTFSSSDIGWKENINLNMHTSLQELNVIPQDEIQDDDLPMLSVYLDSTIDYTTITDLCVSEALIQRPAAWCLDIVMPSSRRSSCFTSAYGKYAKGTGSVLLQNKNSCAIMNGKNELSNDIDENKYKMIPPEERQYDPNWASTLMADGCYLRYFSGNELTRLFGYSDTFTFPAHVTAKQQRKLIGNSLNVSLTSTIVEFAILAYFDTTRMKSK